MSNFKDWLTAARPRTLPLSLACIGMGAFLAASVGKFDTTIFALCVLTTVFLQILSNFSNDYGDTVHGADSKDREGPKRAVQSGAISAKSMKNAITLFSSLSFLAGLSLLWVSFGWNPAVFVVFILLGLLSIYAAITYTSGSRPYGYAGLGDLSVLIFFGLVGVVGTYFLFTKSLSWTVFLPSILWLVFRSSAEHQQCSRYRIRQVSRKKICTSKNWQTKGCNLSLAAAHHGIAFQYNLHAFGV